MKVDPEKFREAMERVHGDIPIVDWSVMKEEWNDIQGRLPAIGFAKQSPSPQSKRAMLFGWLVAQEIKVTEALAICNQTPGNGWDVLESATKWELERRNDDHQNQ